MATLLNFELNESELQEFFARKRKDLEECVFSSSKIQVIHLTDGIAYEFGGVYSLGGKNNRINQIIITELNKVSLTIIETKNLRKLKPKIIKELGFYLTTIYDILRDPDKQDAYDIQVFDSHTVNDLREQIITSKIRKKP